MRISWGLKGMMSRSYLHRGFYLVGTQTKKKSNQVYKQKSVIAARTACCQGDSRCETESNGRGTCLSHGSTLGESDVEAKS